jgi:hypothetical protein
VKELVQVDLSNCTHWNRFVEVHVKLFLSTFKKLVCSAYYLFKEDMLLPPTTLSPCLSLSNCEMNVPLFSKTNMPIYVIAASYNVASSITISNPERFLHCIIFWIQNTIDVQ